MDKEWTAIKYNRSKSTGAYKFSNLSHPLHTDYSYIPINLDVSFFFCLEKAKHGGATIFVDPKLLIELLRSYEPDLYRDLTEKKVILSRGDSPLARNEVITINFDEKGPLLNWSYPRVSKENPTDVLKMADAFHEFLETRVVRGGLGFPVCLEIGEAIFFQDKRVLHGRNAYFGDRCLMKGAIAIFEIEKTRQIVESL